MDLPARFPPTNWKRSARIRASSRSSPNWNCLPPRRPSPRASKRIGANLSPLAKIDGLDVRVNADIAILDTGIAPHPDLNIFTNVSSLPGNHDGNGHGTHVAGIAAAIDNGVGVVGVAPGARLWAIKVMDNTGSGTTRR